MSFSKEFLDKVIDSIRFIDLSEVDRMIDILYELRERGGRLFIIGSGGGAGHASHAACDFNKLCSIESHSLDNIALLTALSNDEGFENSILRWMSMLNFSVLDCVMVISVGGGQGNISKNIYSAVSKAKAIDAKIIGILGPVGGITAELADAKILIQTKSCYVTPITEGIQSIIWHLLVSHPKLKKANPIW